MKHFLTHAIVAAAVVFALPTTARAQQSDQDKMKDKMKDKAMMHDEMAMALAKGTFAGADKHLASGSYEIVTVDGKQVLQTSADLSVDPGAPDVYVVLSSSAKVGKNDGVWLGKLGRHTGAQSFAIPTGAKLDGLTQVVLWCKRYSATIGTASFDPSGVARAMMDQMRSNHQDNR